MIEALQQCEVQPLDSYPLGLFKIVSGALRISDPCYQKDVQPGIAGTIKAANGTWLATSYGRDYGNPVCELEASLGVTDSGKIFVGGEKLPYKKGRFAVGVDSGQAGIFDLSHFQDENLITPETQRPGSTHRPGSTVPFGVVSNSGWGDGLYTAYAKRNSKGEAVAVKIVFIDADEVLKQFGQPEGVIGVINL